MYGRPRRVDTADLGAKRTDHSIRLEINLDEPDQPNWDVEKGAKVQVEDPSTSPAQGSERSFTLLQSYSTKRDTNGLGTESIELIAKDDDQETQPNHTWMSVAHFFYAPMWIHADTIQSHFQDESLSFSQFLVRLSKQSPLRSLTFSRSKL